MGLRSCSSHTADTTCPSRTFLRIATLSAALCCRYRRPRRVPTGRPSLPADYTPRGEELQFRLEQDSVPDSGRSRHEPPRIFWRLQTLSGRASTRWSSRPWNGWRGTTGRGRDAGFPAPPAQIPACAANALGSCLGSERRSAPWAKDAESWVRVASAKRAAASSPSSSGHAGHAAVAPAASAVRPESGTLAALSRWSGRRGTRSNHVRPPAAIAPALE